MLSNKPSQVWKVYYLEHVPEITNCNRDVNQSVNNYKSWKYDKCIFLFTSDEGEIKITLPINFGSDTLVHPEKWKAGTTRVNWTNVNVFIVFKNTSHKYLAVIPYLIPL